MLHVLNAELISVFFSRILYDKNEGSQSKNINPVADPEEEEVYRLSFKLFYDFFLWQLNV